MGIDVYVPRDGLQGQSIPGHVLWGPEQVESISITATREFVELDAFNVDPESTRSGDNTWTFLRFQRPGYLGFVLKTKRCDSLDTEAEVEIAVRCEGRVTSYKRPVRLFRPSLGIEEPPLSIEIDGEGLPSHHLRLRHEGHGTLYVTVSTPDDSPVKTVIPEGLLHAVKGFAGDFAKGLEELKPKYPQYPHLFLPFSKEELQDRDAIGRKLAQAMEEIGADEELSGDVQELFARSLLQNADFESLFFAPLLDFFSSVVSGGTILSMPWLEFDVPQGLSTLTLVIEAKDVLDVEVLKVTLPPIEIRSSKRTTVPIHRVIAWGKLDRAKPSRSPLDHKRPALGGRRRRKVGE